MVLAGIIAGPVFGAISPEQLEPIIPFFGAIALTVILSGGAYRLQLSDVAAAAPRGIILGMSGFTLSVLAVCLFFWLATALSLVRPAPPIAWVMVGAIVGGTSSIVIMPTLVLCKVPARIARMLEVESSSTDALSVVAAMVMIDLVVSGSSDLSRPFIALCRELGLGVVLGVVAASVLAPGIPTIRDKPHGYTLFLGSMFGLYAITQSVNGNGAMAVLTSSLLLGNAASIVPRLFPGARGDIFVASESAKIMQDQMAFLIKSFFFFLIGLMFPMDLRLIALSGVGALLLLAIRIPAVLVSTRNQTLSRKEFWFLCTAMPRGLASGVLATLPLRYGVPGAENLAPAIFALIVLSVLLFAVGFAVVSRLPDKERDGVPVATDAE
jgi:cell volume regulation protein A